VTGVAGAAEIKDSTLDRTASPASKPFLGSRQRRLMCLVSPYYTTVTSYTICRLSPQTC